jgi:hypothetical protein
MSYGAGQRPFFYAILGCEVNGNPMGGQENPRIAFDLYAFRQLMV